LNFSDFSIKSVLKNGTEQKTFTGHAAPVLSVSFIGNDMLVSKYNNNTLKYLLDKS